MTALEPIAPPQVVRLWDLDWQLGARFYDTDTSIGEADPAHRTLTLPIEHPAARWLALRPDRKPLGAFVTIDGPDGRWSGVLQRFKVRRAGDCPECAHCRQQQIVAYWAGA